MTDTIYAVSSGRPPAAIAVIRVSGPAAFAAAAALAGMLPPMRRAGLRGLRDGEGTLLDRALVLAFPAPATATGEELVELHCHGGRAVVEAVGAALAGRGLRPAEPGEFTRRALANGRIDLAQAESLADLLEAETEAQRVAALDGVEGRVGALIDGWRRRLARLSAAVEAELDFADEAEVATASGSATLVGEIARLRDEIAGVLAAPSVERLRDGVRIVVAGPPNAGKSTLLNLLAEREAAIVSPIAGTTRDRVEAPVRRDGTAYLLTDTAGLTRTDDVVEAIGIERARDAMTTADLVLWLGETPPPSQPAIWVQARSDLPGRAQLLPGRDLAIARDDPGSIAALWAIIAKSTSSPTATAPALRDRQRRLCADALLALERCPDHDPILIAEHLRIAHAALARALGVDATEAMLDDLFGRFCIGK